jgi:hypothetical protein
VLLVAEFSSRELGFYIGAREAAITANVINAAVGAIAIVLLFRLVSRLIGAMAR